jgi:5-methylcytosine-specific restriction endonuclease McrA
MAVTRLCSVPRCGHYRTIGTHCATCAAEYQAKDNKRRNKKWQASGANSRAWRMVREQVLMRDDYHCRLRLEDCTGRATTVHLDPRRGGNHVGATTEDCVSACLHCHGVADAPRARGSA